MARQVRDVTGGRVDRGRQVAPLRARRGTLCFAHLVAFIESSGIADDIHALLATIDPDDVEMVSRLRATVYDGAQLDEVPCRFRTVDGGVRSCTVRARPLRDQDSGEVVGAMTRQMALDFLTRGHPEITWKTDYPNLLRLYDKLMQRPSFTETA